MRPDKPLDLTRRVVDGTVGPLVFAETGEGPTLLLVHGAPGTIRDFRWLTPALKKWARVVVVDMPGYGLSHPTQFPATLGGRTAYLSEILDVLEIDRCVVVGHSFGCSAAATLGLREPNRVRGVGMISPIGLRMHHGLRRFKVRPLFKLRHVPFLREPLMGALHQGMQRSGFPAVEVHDVERVLDVLDALDFQAYSEVLHELDTPVWLTHCQDDPLIEQDIVDELVGVLRDREFLTLGHGGHNPQKEFALELAASLQHWVLSRELLSEPVSAASSRVAG